MGKEWIRSLQKLVIEEISLDLSIEDFKAFFKSNQEKTSSSPSGHHMGHYKTLIEGIRRGEPAIAQTLVDIAHIALITTSPLDCWKTTFQVMIDKGKGQFVTNLRIIQLVEVDLNIVLHVVWGH
jgi:hypothetical protein